MTNENKKQGFPPQHQDHQPGTEPEMHPEPKSVDENYKGSGKLSGKVALITGGDSGIGKSVAIYYAKEGADVAIVYLEESNDAHTTKELIEAEGRQCLLLAGDIGSELFCEEVAKKTLDEFGKIDILVNNAAEQHPQKSLLDISADQLGEDIPHECIFDLSSY